MEIDIHASEASDEPRKAFGGIVAGYVQRFDLDLSGGFGPQRFERFDPTSCGAYAPSFADAEASCCEAEAGGSSYDDDAFHGGRVFGLQGQDTTSRRDLQLPDWRIRKKRKPRGAFSEVAGLDLEAVPESKPTRPLNCTGFVRSRARTPLPEGWMSGWS